MSTYKRWFPPFPVGDGITVQPGVLLAQKHWRQHEKRQEQRELRAWESEGGSPATNRIPLQASLFAEVAAGDAEDPSIEKRT